MVVFTTGSERAMEMILARKNGVKNDALLFPDKESRDLVNQLIQNDPKLRLSSADLILKHPFFESEESKNYTKILKENDDLKKLVADLRFEIAGIKSENKCLKEKLVESELKMKLSELE